MNRRFEVEFPDEELSGMPLVPETHHAEDATSAARAGVASFKDRWGFPPSGSCRVTHEALFLKTIVNFEIEDIKS